MMMTFCAAASFSASDLLLNGDQRCVADSWFYVAQTRDSRDHYARKMKENQQVVVKQKVNGNKSLESNGDKLLKLNDFFEYLKRSFRQIFLKNLETQLKKD
jgi:outer membrane protein assembly factor BamE (lipoprotein component of BamABCDE complex)